MIRRLFIIDPGIYLSKKSKKFVFSLSKIVNFTSKNIAEGYI